MNKVAIMQSNYIPWKGYFDLLNTVDDFVIYDTAQYTKNDWRNRNKIKTDKGLEWLTVPVLSKGRTNLSIKEIMTADTKWQKKHWNAIRQNYKKSNFFDDFSDAFEKFYMENNNRYLSEINIHLIKIINELLGINTRIHLSSDFYLQEGRSERLLGICKDLKATCYVSGPSARNYLDEDIFKKDGININWMDYQGYPEYEQLFPPFEHGVTILDLLFNEGPKATRYMKSFA